MPSCRFASAFALALTLLVCVAKPGFAQSEIPGVGTWKLNVSKSRLGAEAPPKSMTSQIEDVDGHARVTGVMIGADGIRLEARYKAKLDGKAYPIIGHPNADTVTLRRIDARTIERVDKKGGKVVETSITTFSDDGKSSSTTGKARNQQGHDFHYVVVHEKQP